MLGEHLTGQEIEAAVADVPRQSAQKRPASPLARSTPRKAEERSRHPFVVEFSRPFDELRIGVFAAKLDQGLSALW